MTRFDKGELDRVLSDVKNTNIESENLMHLPSISGYEKQRETVKLLYDTSEEVFGEIWSRGVPIVVMGVGSKLQIAWSPEYFMSNYGGLNCTVEETAGGTGRTTTVAEFFASFGKYDKSRVVERLKVSCQLLARIDHKRS